ncbi:peptidase M3 [Ktedonosporobacter rubrisoli]|uniref:Peptidase M3 n=1 Tax=Ktedonosporobacter rubrisoli TaxID=2509675 RepID=A0A4V0YYH6_KTERU|nr:M3 family oligoendopeptidase [Ktedonosporobacter rubrisoli]QBD76251.1 peptidase M3 [Ktedonosporobacter rubrisoli]
MYSPLPQSSEEFEQLQWAEIEPWYRELTATALSAENLKEWLGQWSQLSALVDEANTWLEVLTTCNTADEAISQRRQRFLDEVFAPVQSYDQQLKQQLLASGLEPENFAVPLHNLRVDIDLFRAENVPLLNEEKKFNEEYMSITGGRTVVWEGKEVPLSALDPLLLDPDRARREQAWRTMADCRFEDRAALHEVWMKNLRLRQQIASNAGYDNYRAYRWQQLYRFDYTPDDCKQFHEAVEQVIVPVNVQLAEKRRQLLGLETLRPWDCQVDPRASQAPRTIDDIDALLRQCAEMFAQIDPALGNYFDTLIKEQCFDLDDRANKAPGGYNLVREVKHLPFIFGHLRTIMEVIYLVFHEAGHAFHGFESSHLPYMQQRRESMVPIEFAEVASTSMEYVGSVHLASSGLCSKDEARSLRLRHLESTLMDLATISRGDAFQHWVYENPEQAMDMEAVDKKWAELNRRFEPFVDWSGLEAAGSIGWQHILHFFEVPFYYIEYAFATIGALQVWRNYLRDPQDALAQYKHALSLGGTRSLPELYEAAGAKFAFDTATLQDIIHLVTEQRNSLEQEAS